MEYCYHFSVLIYYKNIGKGAYRKVSIKYYKLLDMLNRRGIGKVELKEQTGISSATLAKIAKNEYISLEVIDKICGVLKCQPGDILEYQPDEEA